jgi:hypothetical protein
MKCAGDSNDACDAKLERAEEAWLIQRYPLADFRSVDVTCDANPGRCDDGVGRELLLIDSQNLAARALGDRRENDVVARREEAQTRESAMTTDAALLGVVALGTILSHPHHHHHHW